ncbi:MAG: hypothetical protein LUC95_05350 [Lachnospiraceae bacterium]|nr:hypothetical protein [Lachnospiraceae bacterium]
MRRSNHARRRRGRGSTRILIAAVVVAAVLFWVLVLALLVAQNNGKDTIETSGQFSTGSSADETYDTNNEETADETADYESVDETENGESDDGTQTAVDDTSQTESGQDSLTADSSEDTCVLTQQSDGSILMSWPAVSGAGSYVVEITWEDNNGSSLYRTKTQTNSCVLRGLGDVGTCTVKVRAVTFLFFSRTVLKVKTDLSTPSVSDVTWSLDGNTNTLSATFSIREGDTCVVCLLEDGEVVQEIMTVDSETEDAALTFGVAGVMPLPDQGEEYTIGLCVISEGNGIKYYGLASSTITVSREDLLGTELDVAIAYEGGNVYTFTWNETKGAYYRIQQYDTDAGAWVDVATVSASDDLSYSTGHLKFPESYTYRILAEGGQTDSETGYAAASGEILCTTVASVVYCTVWPAFDLTAYTDADKSAVAGTASAMQAYCVLEEEKNGMFAILLNGETAWIESDYCLINLTDYLGSLCTYNITNSYSSKFTVHEFEIPGVTGEVVVGFEDVELTDNTYVVPLVYSVANKLLDAAKSALRQGYRLKIYESYRPQIATNTLYSTAEALLDTAIPETTYSGVSIESLNLPDAGTVIETVTDEEGNVTQVETQGTLTYRDVMVGDSSYGLSYFLAKSRSKHNSGVALDLTLEDAETGEELQMQTSIHDLSHYASTSENNTNAKLLASIMTEAGFGTLVSEWWHFQDNDSTQTSSMSSVAASIEGWKADDNGYRYCTSTGVYYAGCTVNIGGTAYEFDADGYLVSGF